MAAAAALPLLAGAAAGAGRGALELAQTPVIGWERVETSLRGRSRPRSVVQRTSVQVRAWELGVLGAIGLAGWILLSPKPKPAPADWSWLNALFRLTPL